MPVLQTRLIADSAVSVLAPVLVEVEDSPFPGRVVRLGIESPGNQLFLEMSLREAQALRDGLTREIADQADTWFPKQTWIPV